MTKVFCSMSECVFNKSMVCHAKSIEFIEGACFDYKEYTKLPEYKNTYWIAIEDENGKPWRVKRRGFRKEYRGFVLYTSEDVRTKRGMDEAFFTEAYTGYSVGTLSNLKDVEKLKQMKKKIAETESVMNLPVMTNQQYKNFLKKKGMKKEESDEYPF